MQARPPRESRSDERVEVGRVRRAHGIRGELSVDPASDNPERFAVGAEMDLVPPSGPRRTVRLASIRRHRDRLLISFEGVDDRAAAEALRGAVLEVAESEMPPAPDGAYYYFDLVGCRCRDRTAGELGRVAEILEDGGGLLLAVDRGGRRLLIPFVSVFIERIAVEEEAIDLDLPLGLLEACESTS